MQHIINILGGKKAITEDIQTRLDLVLLTRRGLQKQHLQQIESYLPVSKQQLHKLLGVSRRTIERYNKDQTFKPSLSEHIILIAEVFSKGEEVFKNKEKFKKWLFQENAALGGYPPFSLLDTKQGCDLVTDLLGQIQYGVFS